MAATRTDITVTKDTWINLYAVSTIAVGTSVDLFNKGSYPLLIVSAATTPANNTMGIPLLVTGIAGGSRDYLNVPAGESGLWAYSRGGDGVILVQD